MDKKNTDTYTRQYLEEIIVDLLDGDSKWHDIQYNTGLSEERCKEIEKVYNNICSKLKL